MKNLIKAIIDKLRKIRINFTTSLACGKQDIEIRIHMITPSNSENDDIEIVETKTLTRKQKRKVIEKINSDF
jgi:hypothetical protein